ncbi:class I SAM-dependent methyltransferase [Rhodohalobacter mucosus]|uniref:SAM-dependent methyltransferase n=1 Tax=Rhodohalobacter mucosus TaxID=2079485 RepID=A0A316TX46_9BACT|nr:class I SAM-dependent methyltransferase [Rhodohalobacter mucosus]PWN07815.1 SAM-dependent methyltransferase [Rhodohalobacter mucosus]
MAQQEGKCLHCNHPLTKTFTDLGTSPLCEEFVKPENQNSSQKIYPLHVYVCDECLLVQVHEYVSPEEIYEDYFYFSSYSDSWLKHASDYVDKMMEEYGIGSDHFVVEIASNDGYLLQYFKEKGVPVLGVEPSENVARAAIEKDIPTEKKFFGYDTSKELVSDYKPADLILGNNVLAHVPDINDFVSGLKVMLSEKGFMTFEFPHLMQLVENNQFDTIYHEHFSYFSLLVVDRIFARHGLKLFHVEELKSHGGSIRIYICHKENDDRPVRDSVTNMLRMEEDKGYTDIDFYTSFDEQVKRTKRELLKLFIELKENGKTIAGYGAPGKGNTLLNYCGIGKDFLDYTVDRNPAKHGMFLPGSLVPIYPPDKIRETQPDYVFILPWNLKKEIMNQISYIREWGGKFIIPIPEPEILD